MKSGPRGHDCEQQAAQWLSQQGLHILEKNYRCRQGEIDIIALDQEQLVFVEVRFRASSHFGSAAESIDQRKQAKIRMTAEHYLSCHREHQQRDARFDVMSADGNGKHYEFHWHRAAF